MGWARAVLVGTGLLGMGVILSACGRSGGTPGPGAPTDPFAITNGYVIPKSRDPHPEVVKIKKVGRKFCTATFVAEDPPTLLTASHCLVKLPTAADDSGGGVSYGTVPVRRACVPHGATGSRGPFDIAVLVFEPGKVTVPDTATLAGENPEAKQPVTLVGFGRNDVSPDPEETGSGIKRLGKNYIGRLGGQDDPKHETMIFLKGALQGDLDTMKEVEKERFSATGHGDSGGPLFLETRRGLELIGVTSSGGPTSLGNAFSWFVNLRAPKLRAFLDAALEPEFLEALAGRTRPAKYETVCQLSRP